MIASNAFTRRRRRAKGNGKRETALLRIYRDSVILIYYFEGAPSFKTGATTRLDALLTAGDRLVTSDIVRMECRMQPIRNNDAGQLADYDNLFAAPHIESIPITTAVFDRATRIRAVYNFKLADSLHLAAAVEGRCDKFLTNDLRLNSVTDIPVEVLP